MADFVVFFFDLTNNTKLYHWTTHSHPRHKASDELFESIIDLSDKFMETYMGRYGRPTTKSSSDRSAYKLSLKAFNDKTIVEYYKNCVKHLETAFVTSLSDKDTDLINLRDEILGKLNQTLYLFTLA
jgi:hypothetical protein